MKKITLTLLALVCALCCAFGMVACGENESGDGGSDHKHVYASEWVFDEAYHWHVCNADYECEGSKKIAHKDDNNDKICDECNNYLPSKGLEYEYSGISSGYVLTGIGTCTDTDIVIPMYCTGDEYFGCLPVTNLEYNLFAGNTEITSVIIPDGVEYIGDGAFTNCTALESVTIGKSVKEIEHHAFTGCTSLSGVVIPDSVKTIKYDAFSYCENLTSVTIGKNVESIEHDVFSNAPIENLTFVDSIVPLTIGDSVFSYMPITSLSIPDRITYIGKDVFSNLNVNYIEYENCKYIGNVTNPYFVLVEAIDNKATSYKVHADTKVISGFAFRGSFTDITIEIPVGLKGIGAWLCSGRYNIDVQYKGTVEQFKAIEKMDWTQGVNYWSVTCTDGGDSKK